MDRLLAASKELSDKINSNESAANELLHQCELLQQKFKALIQYQSAVQEISGGEDHPRGPPRIEFSYIRQLQQDNSELRSLLEEHQATLDMIMAKYREQMSSFIGVKNMEDSLSQDALSQEVRYRTDQVCEMASIMYQAAAAEDSTSCASQERIAQLEKENAILREVLSSSLMVATSPVTTEPANPSANVFEQKHEGVSTQSESSDDDSRSTTPRQEEFERR